MNHVTRMAFNVMNVMHFFQTLWEVWHMCYRIFPYSSITQFLPFLPMRPWKERQDFCASKGYLITWLAAQYPMQRRLCVPHLGGKSWNHLLFFLLEKLSYLWELVTQTWFRIQFFLFHLWNMGIHIDRTKMGAIT
jgi:hypothetical protein